MAQDKIHHNLIHINRILFSNQHPKYAIPLFYTAARISQDESKEEIHPRVLKKLRNNFSNFKSTNQEYFNQLDQVHIFMLEQATKIIQGEIFNSMSQIKPSANIFDNEGVQGTQHTIILPQQIYYFDQNQILSEKDNLFPLTNNDRRLVLDTIGNIRGDMEKVWERVQGYYKDHRLDEAYMQYQNFKKECFLQRPNCAIAAQRQQFIKKIEQQYSMMTYYYHFFEEPGYIFDKQQKGVSMYYKIYQQSNEISVRVQAQLDISIQVFLCIVSQIDLFEKYIPFSYQTKQLSRPARNQKIGTTKVYLPLLSDRQAFFFAAAYDRLKTNNSIFFFSKTITSDYNFQRQYNFKVNKHPDFIELQYRFYILQYRPINSNRGKIRLSTNVDLKLHFLPTFVINKTCRIFAFDYFKNLIKVSKKFAGSQWEEKMNQNKDIYDFFKERIKQFVAQ